MIYFSFINSILWILVIIIMIFISFYLTIKFKGIQFRIFKMIKYLFNKKDNNNEINSFKTLMLTLAGKVGVGSISGIALAIYLAGPGTIFWIWIISLLSIPIVYAETYLGIKYRERKNNLYNGGPAYYIKNGLKKMKLGYIYSIIIIISYVIGFVSIQVNTISKSIISFINIRPITIGIILCIITSFIIFNGIKKVVNVTSRIVPIMTIIYLLLGILVIIKNIDIISSVFKIIIDNAFNYKTFGVSFLTTMIMGIQRGIFSNEAGIGTGSIAASINEDNNIISSGYIQMFGVYITSFLICTITSIIVIISNYEMLNIHDPNGIEIALFSFNYHFGNLGNILLICLILLFAFSTILSAYYYGEVSLSYLNTNNTLIIKFLLLITIIIGSIISSSSIWLFIDLNMAILAIINIYAIYKLRNDIKT